MAVSAVFWALRAQNKSKTVFFRFYSICTVSSTRNKIWVTFIIGKMAKCSKLTKIAPKMAVSAILVNFEHVICSLNFTWPHFHCTTLFFIIILPRKVHYLFRSFEKSGKKVGHPQKSCLTPPLRGGGGGGGGGGVQP